MTQYLVVELLHYWKITITYNTIGIAKATPYVYGIEVSVETDYKPLIALIHKNTHWITFCDGVYQYKNINSVLVIARIPIYQELKHK
jgi:hypothetical protein